jgi:inner membrane protein
LFFIPVGKTTKTIIRSTWNSPSFSGRFLPSERTINSSGFNAEWNVTNLNRNFPQSWIGNTYNINENSYGVDLFLTVDHYQKAFRCAKYGLLFIALTFMVLIFLELTAEDKIHIFNYFLVALALALFFSLLTALSEHLGFNYAYLLSSVATITMLTLFTRSFLTKRSAVLIVSGLLVFLYAFIYVILSLNDFAFLAGNIGLFFLLSIVMWFSGKINLFKKEGMDNNQ